MLIRLAGLFCWAFGVWVLLTWTLTAEQLLFGAVAAAVVALALAPLGPWPARGGCCGPAPLPVASGC
jgi:multicomponent Na+:H+ antiporter subunit E